MVNTWTFLSNHGHILLLLAKYPTMTLREVALQVDITERAVQRIVKELLEEGHLEVQKLGRRNEYKVLKSKKLRHPIERENSVGEFLKAIKVSSVKS